MESDFQLIEEDPYGPGSDLMISLFSVAILLLGIVGAGDQYSRVEEASIARSQAAAALPVENKQESGYRSAAEIAPLKLASRDELAALERRLEERDTALAALQAERDRLQQDYQKQTVELGDKTLKLNGMNATLSEAQKRLEDLQKQTADETLDLTSFDIAAEKLAPFFDDPKRIKLSVSGETLKRMAEKALPLSPDMNQILIETRLPPELLALAPSSDDPQKMFSDFYFLSAGLGEAYRLALANAGFPLACLKLDAGSFDDAATMRRKIMVENLGAADSFSEVATFFRNIPAAQARTAEARVSIRLGGDADSRCDRHLLSTLFGSF